MTSFPERKQAPGTPSQAKPARRRPTRPAGRAPAPAHPTRAPYSGTNGAGSFSRVAVHALRGAPAIETHRWQSAPPGGGSPAPANPPATPPANCATAFAGHTFTLSNQTGAGASPAAAARNVLSGGNPFVHVRGTTPAAYTPTVTAAGPRTADYEAGLIQNVLTGTRIATYTTGATVSTQPATLPIKDGAPASSGLYDVDFAENGGGHPGVLVRFAAGGGAAALRLPDTPGGGGFLNLWDEPACQGPYAQARLTSLRFNDTFRTWVGVRHRPTGCVRTIHHIDWETDWSLTVGAGTPAPLTFTANRINVTVANGNGGPAYIRGGPVPADGITKTCQ